MPPSLAPTAGQAGPPGNDEARRAQEAERGLDVKKAVAAFGLANGSAREKVRAVRERAFKQGVRKPVGRRGAENAAVIPFFPGDAEGVQHVQHKGGRTAAQRSFRKARLLAHIPLGADAAVGDIAAPAAGKAKFPACLRGVIDQGATKAAFARDKGAHESGRAGSDDDGVVHDRPVSSPKDRAGGGTGRERHGAAGRVRARCGPDGQVP